MKTIFSANGVDHRDRLVPYFAKLLTDAEEKGLSDQTTEYEMVIHINGIEVDFRKVIDSINEYMTDELSGLRKQVACHKQMQFDNQLTLNLDSQLISTALLALQDSGKFKFGFKSDNTFKFSLESGNTFKTGFLKEVVEPGTHPNSDYVIVFYMDKKSPTGYSIEVQAVAVSPFVSILKRCIVNFEDFEELIETDHTKLASESAQRSLGKE
jgi:hypothetical protein